MRLFAIWIMGVLLLVAMAGCRKKAPVAAAPPAPKAAAPEAPKPGAPVISEFTAEPSRIERGQTALLRWQVKDATQIEINHGVGAVTASGRHEIKPGESTTYTLVAKGPGGTATADTTLNVLPAPPPALPTPSNPAPGIGERLNSEVQDVFFDYDKSTIRADTQAALTKDATALKAILSDFPNTTVIVEGHCDERGSAEYNLALGDRRATAAKDFLTQLGVPADRLIKISYGKERPQCGNSNEACWQKNRRAHFAPGETQRPKASGELIPAGGKTDSSPKADREN